MQGRLLIGAMFLSLGGLVSSGCESSPDEVATEWIEASHIPKPVGAFKPGLVLLRPEALALSPGQSAQLAVELFDSSGQPQSPPALTLSSDDPEVVQVDAHGVVTAHRRGGASITAWTEYGLVATTVVVTETPPAEPLAIRFEEPLVVAGPGAMRPLPFRVTGGSGEVLASPDSLEFTSSAPDVATVDAGVLRTGSAGTALIFASVGDDVLAGQQLVVVVLIPNLPPLNSASGRRVAGARFARGERG